jgi:hypothetical protein
VRIRPLCVEQQPHSDFKTALAIHPDQKTVQVFQQGLQLQPEQGDTLKMQYRGNMEFQFDQLGDVSVEQSEVFESIGKPIVDNCLEGYNGSIIAYGQTGKFRFSSFSDLNCSIVKALVKRLRCKEMSMKQD